jgi:hypothetical protein
MARVTGMFKSPTGVSNPLSTPYECTSVTNEKLLKLPRNECEDYCRRSFLRIYPVATELASGNYDPIPGLARGAQIIALNTQTKDDSAWLMMSYFTAGCDRELTRKGYVEKPIWMRSNVKRDSRLRKIEITVLSSIFDVQVRFFGTEEDLKRNEGSKLSFHVRDYC